MLPTALESFDLADAADFAAVVVCAVNDVAGAARCQDIGFVAVALAVNACPVCQ